MTILLQTERLLLRNFTEADVNNLFELDSDPEVMRYINGGYISDYEIIKNRTLPKILGYYQKYEHYGFWAVIEKNSDNFIGWFHFYPAIENQFAVEINLVKDHEIALGYRLRKSTWGKGYATEGSQALILKGFTEWGVQRVVAWALVVNKASTRVMEKVGLKVEKEFVFEASQLPNLPTFERKAVKYGLNQDEFMLNKSQAR
jgi:[ribosomal protein S5]-alanine N-acetyltransferase